MNIQFKNLSVNFIHQDAEFSGEALLIVPSEYVKEFFEDTEGCEFGIDAVDEYEGGDLGIFNTDFQIIFMSWAMDKEHNVSFDYHSENLFWLYHDFHHAIHDVCGTDIYVNGQLEAERHYQAIKLLVERNQIGVIDLGFLKGHVKDFQDRSAVQNSFNADDFDLNKACQLAGFDTTENHCPECGHDGEPIEMTDEDKEECEDEDHTHKCEECEVTGEEYIFSYDLLELDY